ncbi:hypothetical protein Lal_00020123, partial [Lupinus albus]
KLNPHHKIDQTKSSRVPATKLSLLNWPISDRRIKYLFKLVLLNCPLDLDQYSKRFQQLKSYLCAQGAQVLFGEGKEVQLQSQQIFETVSSMKELPLSMCSYTKHPYSGQAPSRSTILGCLMRLSTSTYA